jgi:1,4-alpha-glucan branching enzyme
MRVPAQPTGRLGLLRIPAPGASEVKMRFSPLAQRDKFSPSGWPVRALRSAGQANPGWWEIDIDALSLPDGDYEYEFILDSHTDRPVSDPFADEITRFGGYRGVFHISAGQRVGPAFRWDDEFTPGKPLSKNNAIVIYEMPVKWMSSDPDENPLVELGTLERVIFEQLDRLAELGINCIELLPIEDTSQTLDWGYGTRFFFAPDYDLGSPIDTRFFVKVCHQRGIRVLMDVVMNFFSPTCPLADLALNRFSVPSGTDGRQDFGQRLFRFNTLSDDGSFAARDFLLYMGEFWTSEYHVDGFRIDDFADIRNWDFMQEFRTRTFRAANAVTAGKPFIIIAEDSRRDFSSTDQSAYHGRPVVDAIWNFGYRDEVRLLATDHITTQFGQASRSERVRHLISKDGVWNDDFGHGHFDLGYSDLANSVDYATSHDVADAERMMNYLLSSILRAQGLGPSDIGDVRSAVDTAGQHPSQQSLQRNGAVAFALYRVFGVFALMLTSVGIPMFLAGEEFGDVHDLAFSDSESKQQDPVQFCRLAFPGNYTLQNQVGRLIALRASHPSLQRNEVQFFYFHPQFDDNDAPRVFGYARTAGSPVGNIRQVIVMANMGPQKFPSYDVPDWPWRALPVTEIGEMGPLTDRPIYDASSGGLTLGLDAFQVRVFTT